MYREPRFFDLGVKLAYDFKLYKTVDLQLNGGVQNLFESFGHCAQFGVLGGDIHALH